MFAKKTTALLGCALLIIAAAPVGLAHQTSASQTSDDLTPLSLKDDWRRGSGGTSGVSGNYFGAAAAYVQSSSAFPDLEDNAIFAAFMLCDLEVLGDGSGHDPLDESKVDDDPHAPSGSIPDGTFDDGGAGGACHTNDQYSHSEYNTDGCGGTAYAEDAVFGAAVFIGAACDWATHGSGPGLGICLINEVISEPTVGGLQQCVADFLAGGATGSFVSCGDDSSADDANYGAGGGQTGAGVAFPTPQDGCTDDHASAAVFAFNYASQHAPGAAGVTAGWIDTSGDSVDQSHVKWFGPATVVVEGFPASADEGFVACRSTDGSGVGGFCIHDNDATGVEVNDALLGKKVAFQVCRDDKPPFGICTNDETFYSHGIGGGFVNPIAVPGNAGTGQIVVFVCAGAHANSSEGIHDHEATHGTGQRSDGAPVGFDDVTGYCGGSTGGGPGASSSSKRYVVV